MAFFYGQYEGLDRWQPNYLPSCSVWLDASDVSTITKYDNNKNVAVFADKSTSEILGVELGLNRSWTGTGVSSSDSYYTLHHVDNITGSKENCWLGSFTNDVGKMFKVEFDLTINSLTGNGIYIQIVGSTSSTFPRSNIVRIDNIENGDGHYTLYFIGNQTDASSFLNFATVNNSVTVDLNFTNITIKEVTSGNHFVQEVTSAQPLYNGSSSIELDGVQEFFELKDFSTGSFASDNIGEFIAVVDDLEGTGVLNSFLATGDVSASNDYMNAGFGTADDLYMTYNGFNRSSADSYTRGGTSIIGFSSNGSRHLGQINGTFNIALANSNGHWFNEQNFVSWFLGRRPRSTPLYWNQNIKEVIYYQGRELTDKERRMVHSYLNKKWGVY